MAGFILDHIRGDGAGDNNNVVYSKRQQYGDDSYKNSNNNNNHNNNHNNNSVKPTIAMGDGTTLLQPNDFMVFYNTHSKCKSRAIQSVYSNTYRDKEASSNVAPQPVGWQEIYTGASNRLDAMSLKLDVLLRHVDMYCANLVSLQNQLSTQFLLFDDNSGDGDSGDSKVSKLDALCRGILCCYKAKTTTAATTKSEIVDDDGDNDSDNDDDHFIDVDQFLQCVARYNKTGVLRLRSIAIESGIIPDAVGRLFEGSIILQRTIEMRRSYSGDNMSQHWNTNTTQYMTAYRVDGPRIPIALLIQVRGVSHQQITVGELLRTYKPELNPKDWYMCDLGTPEFASLWSEETFPLFKNINRSNDDSSNNNNIDSDNTLKFPYSREYAIAQAIATHIHC
jgi:hypothetical protein